MKDSNAGQSLIESCLAVFLISLIFAGLFQVVQVLAAREVLSYGALCAARARTVGFNRWMVRKSLRVACIPNAGPIVEPAFVNQDPVLRAQLAARRSGDFWSWVLRQAPSSRQLELERARIPEYMESDNEPRGRAILDYRDWDTIRLDIADSTAGGAAASIPIIESIAAQEYPLSSPLHRAFYAADTVRLRGEASLENHFLFYMDDEHR